MLKITSLSKSYGSKKVIDNLNFEILKPSIIHIRGTNGCGKTTLFKLIAEIEEPDSGIIEKSDIVHLGVVIENGGFIENKSLKYNLEYLINVRKEATINYAKDLCTMFSLDFESNKKIKDFSIGMRQKAGIIQAVMENQNLIILDEPSRGMDEESVIVFSRLIEDLKKDNKTVIIASHEILDRICFDEIYVMENGRLEREI